jgi:hypothetical protein
MRLETKVVTNIPKKLFDEVNRQAIVILKRAVDKAIPKIYDQVKEAVIERLKITTVYQELVGSSFGGRNIRAEFGLTDEMAESAAQSLLQIIGDTVNKPQPSIQQTSRSFNIKVNVSALAPSRYEDLFRNGSEFRHNNPGGNETVDIRWMEWLLDRATDVAEGFGITYFLYDGEESRSGQAIMIPAFIAGAGSNSPNPRYKGPYTLPLSLVPSGKSKNFIEEMVNDNRFVARIKSLVTSEINTQISRSI